jgi:glucosamine-6-phosphate deaminase
VNHHIIGGGEPAPASRARFDAAEVVIDTQAAGGAQAADALARSLDREVRAHGRASVILATGNSQLAFLAALRQRDDVPWDRVTVFHMDEYVGMAAEHPASFRRYMQERLIDAVRPAAFHGIRGDAPDIQGELDRYAGLLAAQPPVACVLGIGENGHLAFNDPPADFDAPVPIHVVRLSDASRRQQVGEGHFPTFESVPEEAVTLTIPALLAPERILAVVPESRKATAVRAALLGPVSQDCPASILRQTRGVTVFLDHESAALL